MPTSHELMVATGGSPEVRVVEAAGSVDLFTVAELADHLSAALAEEATLTVVVDLRRVDFLSAAGLRALVNADQRAQAQDTTLRILIGTRAVGRALSVTGLDRTLTIY